jgi:hypothetical protein
MAGVSGDARREATQGHPPAPFICGVARSGTTLLRLMLDAHPEVAIPPETHFVPDLIARLDAIEDPTPSDALAPIRAQREWEDFGFSDDELLERFAGLDRLTAPAAIRAFFEAYAERHGKRRWGDKTPMYVKRMAAIEGVLPEARFVHLIRDGRDIALSRDERRAGRGLDGPPVDRVARRWKRRIRDARRQAPGLSHYLEVRYEDLVLDTEPVLRRVCDFIELDFDPAMLRYHERAGERLAELDHDLPIGGGELLPAGARMRTHRLALEEPRPERIGRWRREMSAADRAAFEEVAGELLAELGYEVGGG